MAQQNKTIQYYNPNSSGFKLEMSFLGLDPDKDKFLVISNSSHHPKREVGIEKLSKCLVITTPNNTKVPAYLDVNPSEKQISAKLRSINLYGNDSYKIIPLQWIQEYAMNKPANMKEVMCLMFADKEYSREISAASEKLADIYKSIIIQREPMLLSL